MAQDEIIEATIVIGENRLKSMVNEIAEARRKGQESVIVEIGAINFQIYVEESVRLMELDEKTS